MDQPTLIVNVEGAIYHDGKWLLVRRSEKEEHAKGALSLVGGKAESVELPDILENTLVREIKEETDVTVKSEMYYVESKSFSIGKGRLVVDIVFVCFYDGGVARPMDTDELSEVLWLSTDDVVASDSIPSWTKESITKAARVLENQKNEGSPANLTI